MSIRVMARVWDDPGIQDHYELLVLLALADFSNEEGDCWPSIPTIARKSRLGERSVYVIIDRLIASGRLVKEVGGGRGHSNRYHLNPAPQTLNGKHCLRNTECGATETLHGVQINPAPGAPEPLYNHQLEPPIQKPRRKLAGSVELVALPECLDSEQFRTALQHWVDHKKIKRDPMTQHAIDLLVKRCEAWGLKKAIANIEHSIEKGWRGVYPPNEAPPVNGTTPKSNSGFVTKDKIDDWCARKGYSKLAPVARGKLLSGRLYGAPISNGQDFNDAMSALLSDWLKTP